MEDQPDFGKPNKFNPELFCDVAEQLIESDEIERAIWMLDNMPGYYRENPYQRAIDIKKRIFKVLMSTEDYASDVAEHNEQEVEMIMGSFFTYPRYDILSALLIEYNQQGKKPHVFEFGPASFWLPRLLKKHNINFAYTHRTINRSASKHFQGWLETNPIEASDNMTSEPKIFVCFEVIEHLWNTLDIAHFYEKFGIIADHIFMSTPLNTLLGGHPDKWDSRELGHLRTYTKQEFLEFVFKTFPGYQWQLTPAQMMVLRGDKV